jgi:serine/threonine protein kinase
VANPISGGRYKIGRVLGEGGFGKAYLASSLTARGKVIEEVCLKTTLDQSSWHRESYFGELLSGSTRVIETLDSFAIASWSDPADLLFCLVLELAQYGTIVDYLESTGKPFTEKRAVREISALLKVLDQLHGAAATHRDLTPMNVFVCGRGRLKLGDFGIARHELAGNRRSVEAFNPEFVTKGFLDNHHRHWHAVDDVYQMGQLLGMLLSGDSNEKVTARAVNKLDASTRLKQIIKRAIGIRGKRYGDAFEFLQALNGEEAPQQTVLDSLDGKKIVFTGPLTMSRYDAKLLVLQVGGEVVTNVTKDVDVVVQGGRSQNYKSGHKGEKLQKAQDLLKKGANISIIGEAEFRRLVRGELA